MSRYPWRDTSTDIAGGQPPQWETPQGAQNKADDALTEAKDYTDEQNVNFNAHIEDTTIHVTPADKANWNSKAPGVHTHANATPTTPGFMSAEDYTKLKGVEADANKYVHPATHPPAIIAQDTGNRFVSDAEKAAWNGKAETTEATTAAKGLMSAPDKQKLNGIQAEAEVNQNAFSQINDVVASGKSDNLFFVGGIGITITTDPVTKRLIVTATGDATPGAHASSHITGGTDVIPDAVNGGSSGLMSGADAKFVRQDGETKTGAQAKADAAEEAANEYTDQKVGEIVIGDASLTDKGIVQLSNAIDGTSETLAPTEKAVNDARLSALSESKTYVNELAWQKYPLTETNGGANQLPSGSDLNSLVETGFYYVPAAVNGPSASTFFVEVITQKNAAGVPVFLMQRAVRVGVTTQTFYQRNYNNGTWYPWSVDLFTSVSDGKTAIAAAITGKGVAASGSDTFPQLATKIGQIETGVKYATGTVTSSSSSRNFLYQNQNVSPLSTFFVTVTGLGFRPTRIIMRVASAGTMVQFVYDWSLRSPVPAVAVGNNFSYAMLYGNNVYGIKVHSIVGSGVSSSDGYVNDNSFLLPVTAMNIPIIWEAFGV